MHAWPPWKTSFIHHTLRSAESWEGEGLGGPPRSQGRLATGRRNISQNTSSCPRLKKAKADQPMVAMLSPSHRGLTHLGAVTAVRVTPNARKKAKRYKVSLVRRRMRGPPGNSHSYFRCYRSHEDE